MHFSLTLLSLATLAIATPLVNTVRQTTDDLKLVKPIGHLNLCMGVETNELENGNEVSFADCESPSIDKHIWHFDGASPGPIKLNLTNGNGIEYCLDAGSNPASGTLLKIWQCYDGLPQQTWIHNSENHIKLNSFNQCLDIKDGKFNNNGGNTFVQTWTCTTGNTNQRFTVQTAGDE
ncbi:ricin B lectin domain-containing protein [Flagelloscypha sp. PMI_526]|nr:ricin B lectin domain-containing protein [Flagelloscypha sp. PMI_526]